MKNINFQCLVLLIFFTVLMACPSAFCGAAVDLDVCILKLEKRYSEMKDISAFFKQETFLSTANRIERADGKVYIKKGGRMFWDYKTPVSQKIILDGETLWVYLPDEKQVMKNSMVSVSSNIVVDLFQGRINIRKRFNTAVVKGAQPKNTEKIVLSLLPKEYNPTLRSLVLEIDPASFLITKTVLDDELGTKTTLVFDRIEVDKGLEDSFFTFIPPPGVEIFSPPKF